MCIATNQPDTKSNPYPNHTTKQRAIVNIQLSVTCPVYLEKFVQCYCTFFYNFMLSLYHSLMSTYNTVIIHWCKHLFICIFITVLIQFTEFNLVGTVIFWPPCVSTGYRIELTRAHNKHLKCFKNKQTVHHINKWQHESQIKLSNLSDNNVIRGMVICGLPNFAKVLC